MKYSKATLKAIDESIAHWERMIKAAKNLNGEIIYVLFGDFPRLNGESWTAEFCALCRKFTKNHVCSGKCPLGKIDLRCDNDGSSWMKVRNAETWKEWRKAARNMLKVLKGLKQ